MVADDFEFIGPVRPALCSEYPHTRRRSGPLLTSRSAVCISTIPWRWIVGMRLRRR
ncbi:hypothetical protein CYLTODRAFT_495587, partial [Cylindrobasidium torrendii FP15055 ss-10]